MSDRRSGSLFAGILPPVQDDGELESMLSDLQEVSVSRTSERRNWGVDGLSEENTSAGRQDESESQTPGVWSGPREGTSGSVFQSIYGQPATTLSEGESSVRFPKSVSVRSGRVSTAKKFKLVRLPQTEEAYEELCLGLIGHGYTFCTARRCKTAHQGTVLSVTPGELYIAKTATTAFAEPKSHIQRLTPELWSEWNNLSCTQEEWNRLFMLVNEKTEEGPVTAAEIEARATFAAKAEAHRTPGKRKLSADEAPGFSDSGYKRQLRSRNPDEEDPFSIESKEAFEILENVDIGLEKTSGQILHLQVNQSEMEKDLYLTSRSLEHKMIKIESEVGGKPQALAADINAPTIWGSIGALGAKLDGVVIAQKKYPSPALSKEVARVVEPFKKDLCESMAERAMALEDRINKVKSFVVRSTKRMNEKIESEVLDMGWDSKPPAPLPAASALSKPEWMEEVIKGFEVRLDKVSERLSQVTAETDEQAIRFAGLGFRTSREANAWLVLHMPDHHCGLVVDLHMVMEHVQAAIAGQDSISRLEKLFKLKIKTLADGLAMTSFETKVPRYFSQTNVHKVVKHDASHFDTISTFEDWDAPISGFRTRLKEELSTFRAAHQENIDEALHRDSIGYAIATMALTEAVSWLDGFIVFLDDYHRDLTKAKFGSKKAWHVATRLGRRMLLEIAVPRNGVQNSFQAGRNDQICQRIFWSVLKSHDIMARYKRHNYKDDPTVSSELVKFLAVNTGFEALDTLVGKVSVLEESVATLKKEVQASIKASASASNKADEGKKFYDLLLKRVVKLEK
jgi:hypothetical protein